VSGSDLKSKTMKKFFDCLRFSSSRLMSRFASSTAPRRGEQCSVVSDGLHVRQTKYADVVPENSVTETRVEHMEHVDDVATLHSTTRSELP